MEYGGGNGRVCGRFACIPKQALKSLCPIPTPRHAAPRHATAHIDSCLASPLENAITGEIRSQHQRAIDATTLDDGDLGSSGRSADAEDS